MEGLKHDHGKPSMELLPFAALIEVAKVLSFGAKKYAPNSWQNLPNGEDRYLGAMMRHIAAYKEGEETDPESGLHHLSHVACNALFILWLILKKAPK